MAAKHMKERPPKRARYALRLLPDFVNEKIFTANLNFISNSSYPEPVIYSGKFRYCQTKKLLVEKQIPVTCIFHESAQYLHSNFTFRFEVFNPL
jgi:hypothetical protein